MKKIVLTGGGTAGHVIPNIAMIPELKNKNYKIYYIGRQSGIERELIEGEKIEYFGIESGKLRRYFDVKNFTDPFKVVKGLFQAYEIVRKIKPDVIFSKGGFVTVPVIIAGWMNRVPCIIHESDMTPGLANKISIPFAKKICTTFPETVKYLPKEKGVFTGTPIRKEIFSGKKEEGYRLTGFNNQKPVLMIIGGSLGSRKINEIVREVLGELTKKYQVLHLCGKGNMDEKLAYKKDYFQLEYAKDELFHLFATADMIISRAGANAISEILALKKPNILIPLSAKASRGDQILNANSFKKQGFSKVIDEENLNPKLLTDSVDNLWIKKDKFIKNMEKSNQASGIKAVIRILEAN